MVECCAIDLNQVPVTDTCYGNTPAVKTGQDIRRMDFRGVLKDAGCRFHNGGADKRPVIERRGKITVGAHAVNPHHEEYRGEADDSADDKDTLTEQDVMPLHVTPFSLSPPGELPWSFSRMQAENGMEITGIVAQIDNNEPLQEVPRDPVAVFGPVNDMPVTGEQNPAATLSAVNDIPGGGRAETNTVQIQTESFPPVNQGAILAGKTGNVRDQEASMPNEESVSGSAGAGPEDGKEIPHGGVLSESEAGETATGAKGDATTGYAKQAEETTDGIDGKEDNNRPEKRERQKEHEPAPDSRTHVKLAGNAVEKSRRDGNNMAFKREHKWTADMADGYKVPDEAATSTGSSNEIPEARSAASYSRISDSVVKQVMDNIAMNARVIIGDDKSEMVMSLKPDNLGKLSLKVVSENGIIKAEFIAESQQVKEILESNMQLLKDSLDGQGIPLEGFSVSVGGDDSHSDRWSNEGKLKSPVIPGEIELPVVAPDASKYGKAWTGFYPGGSSNIDLMA
jgi:hypothetical protein